MAETTDLERKSLEAHVDLCAQRYRFLEQKLDTVEEKILALNTVIREVHDMVQIMSEKRNDQLINWGLGIMGTMLAVIAYLVTTFVMP
jgi:hypothetical protein